MRDFLRTAARWLFWLWAPVPVVLIGLLLSGHLLTLPKPSTIRVEGEGWRALHVLAIKCACSRGVIEHLISRGAVRGVTEKVVLIGEDLASMKRLRAAGYEVEALSSAAVKARYGIEGAPLLAVVNPQQDLVYSGGYSRQARGTPEDLAIFATVQAGNGAASLPLYGCATTRELQAQLDPMGLKYGGGE